jgi:hypothetical protein
MEKFMKISIHKTLLILMTGALTFIGTSCEDEFQVKRSKDLLIAGPTEVYVGDLNTFQAPLFTYKDTRTWSWTATGTGASETSGEGEFFDVAFQPGTYTFHRSRSL